MVETAVKSIPSNQKLLIIEFACTRSRYKELVKELSITVKL
jgi:hypothetical protein